MKRWHLIQWMQKKKYDEVKRLAEVRDTWWRKMTPQKTASNLTITYQWGECLQLSRHPAPRQQQGPKCATMTDLKVIRTYLKL